MRKRFHYLLLVASVLVSMSAAGEASVTDLDWMTGSWRGKMGPNIIEETWSKPSSNSIQASVRIIANEAAVIHEFIVISKVEDSLELALQQWAPGYAPLGPATKMKLVELTENSVTFKASEGAEIQQLTYRRRDEATFEIAVTTKSAPEFVMVLSPLD
ncbi:MAG: hypothetical protein F4W90_11005 [Gammaproteobacteria bacterium]|nr:hypothetical protein [Gammaproteobacteria bacterium]